MDKLIGWGREFGPVYKLVVPGTTRVIVSGADLVAEICDDDRFDKQLGAGLVAARGTSDPPGCSQRDRGPDVAARAQHPDGALQPVQACAATCRGWSTSPVS